MTENETDPLEIAEQKLDLEDARIRVLSLLYLFAPLHLALQLDPEQAQRAAQGLLEAEAQLQRDKLESSPTVSALLEIAQNLLSTPNAAREYFDKYDELLRELRDELLAPLMSS